MVAGTVITGPLIESFQQPPPRGFVWILGAVRLIPGKYPRQESVASGALKP